MLMIGYLILVVISYLAIPAAYEVSSWLALLFLGTIVYSIIGFYYAIPKNNRANQLETS